MTVNWKECRHYKREELKYEQEDNNPKRNSEKMYSNTFMIQVIQLHYIYNTNTTPTENQFLVTSQIFKALVIQKTWGWHKAANQR